MFCPAAHLAACSAVHPDDAQPARNSASCRRAVGDARQRCQRTHCDDLIDACIEHETPSQYRPREPPRGAAHRASNQESDGTSLLAPGCQTCWQFLTAALCHLSCHRRKFLFAGARKRHPSSRPHCRRADQRRPRRACQTARTSATSRPPAKRAPCVRPRLLGKSVDSHTGKGIGEIQDPVIDMGANKVH